MLWCLYNTLFAVAYVLVLPKFLWRMWRRGGYRKGFLQRFGRYDGEVAARLGEGPRVWIHAVSVGELYVALCFRDELARRRPGTRFVLTTNTSTAHRIASERLHPDDVLLYFPVDYPPVMRRVFRRLRPEALILTENEIWPNLVREASRCGVPVVVINGRISESSYGGYRRLRVFFSRVLARVRLFLVQSAVDGERLAALGAPADRIEVVGTAKYDVTLLEPSDGGRARTALRQAGIRDGDLVLLGGSTWPGEEDALLDIHRKLSASLPGLRLVLVPRHAERRADVEASIRARGLRGILRTELGEGDAAMAPDPAAVLLVDTTGELRSFYACASVIFVGKSLTQHGGQNIIEPAAQAKAIVVGPNMENFAAVTQDFLAAEALLQVASAEDLEKAVSRLLADEALREAQGRRARALVERMAGAIPRTVERVIPLLPRP